MECEGPPPVEYHGIFMPRSELSPEEQLDEMIAALEAKSASARERLDHIQASSTHVTKQAGQKHIFLYTYIANRMLCLYP